MIELDDYGMLLLENTREAFDAYQATVDEKAAEVSKVLQGQEPAERALYLGRSLRERDDQFVNLAIELVGHLWAIESWCNLGLVRSTSCNVTLTEQTVELLHQLRGHVEGDGPGSLAVAFLRETVLPAIFEDAVRS